MKKLTLFFLLLIITSSCSSIKFLEEGEKLLVKNDIYIDSVKTTSDSLDEYVIQKPNTKTLGIPLSLYFYNLGAKNGSKNVTEWSKRHPKTYNTVKKIFSEKQSIALARSFINLNNWPLKNGQKPVVLDSIKTERTIKNLQAYYRTQGFFKNTVYAKTDSVNYKKQKVSYYISKGKPLFLDSIYYNIKSPVLDSLYNTKSNLSYLKKGTQYKDQNFINEANRITKLFRNNGIYHFNENSIGFYEIDTTKNKTDVLLKIKDRVIEKNGSYESKPFEIQKIKKVTIYTDYAFNKKKLAPKDSASFDGKKFISYEKLKYKPKHLSQSIFIKPNQIYSDSLRKLTRLHLRSLKNFKTTTIKYKKLENNWLETAIYLSPIEKYSLAVETELSRSNIRDYDVSAQLSLINRNTFKGAELFKLSVFGSYFGSKRGPGWELGGDLSLEIPRMMAPFGIDKSFPKRMFPKTKFNTRLSFQKNIGLDKQNISLGIEYKWNPDSKKTIQVNLLDVQYIRNLNVKNYFNIYNSEFEKLKFISQEYQPGTEFKSDLGSIIGFMQTVKNDTVFQTQNPDIHQLNSNVLNRYNIITSDFLIPETAYSFTYNNQENYKDQSFSFFRIRIANSGSFLGYINNEENTNQKSTLLEIPVAQYFKTDIEYKKYWNVGGNSVLAYRTFLGAIITYNNSDVPFSKSYFAGGSNDIRGWRTYELGPGSRNTGLEYNIGSLKFLTSLEYRFDVVGSLKGALFTDMGNIWDITNSPLIDKPSKFEGFKSLEEIAVAGGFGIRYDFKFLVARLDVGFKTYEPYLQTNKWFHNFNFGKAVYNIGINYPF